MAPSENHRPHRTSKHKGNRPRESRSSGSTGRKGASSRPKRDTRHSRPEEETYLEMFIGFFRALRTAINKKLFPEPIRVSRKPSGHRSRRSGKKTRSGNHSRTASRKPLQPALNETSPGLKFDETELAERYRKVSTRKSSKTTASAPVKEEDIAPEAREDSPDKSPESLRHHAQKKRTRSRRGRSRPSASKLRPAVDDSPGRPSSSSHDETDGRRYSRHSLREGKAGKSGRQRRRKSKRSSGD